MYANQNQYKTDGLHPKNPTQAIFVTQFDLIDRQLRRAVSYYPNIL
jgi:hypothetical protein